MRLTSMIDWNTGKPYPCEHPGYHCSIVSFQRPYAVTRGIPHPTDEVVVPEFIRWSTPDDPPFPCVCDCAGCGEWRVANPPLPLPVS